LKNSTLTEYRYSIFVSNRTPLIQSLSKATASDRFLQVADKSVFIGSIRIKINEVLKEIKRLPSEVETKKYG
jgi:hypothetical protein